MNDPILVTGFQRSGTTALAYILNKHIPKFMNETNIMQNLIRDFSIMNSEITHMMKERYVFDFDCFDWKILRAYIMSSYQKFYKTEMYKHHFTIDEKHQKTTVIGDYEPQNIYSEMWGDKITNFAAHVPAFKRLFPEGKIIYIMRNGLNCVASNLRMGWGDEAYLWTRWISEIKTYLEWAPTIPHLLIKQSDLQSNPILTIGQVGEFLGIETYPSAMQIFIHKAASEDEKPIKEETFPNYFVKNIPTEAHQLIRNLF